MSDPLKQIALDFAIKSGCGSKAEDIVAAATKFHGFLDDAPDFSTADGWLIQIEPGDHPAVTSEPWEMLVPYASDKIRPSGDGEFHVCIGLISKSLFCLYTPDGQWGV